MEQKRQPVLSLTSVTDGPFIVFDKRRYDLRDPNALPLGVLKKFQRIAPRISDLAELEDPTDEEAQELSDLLAYFTSKAVDAPPDIQKKFTDVQRLMVMQVFTQLRPTPTAPTAATKAKKNPPRSVKRSRG